MTLTDKQQEEFRDGADLMIKWLNDNCHPHCSMIITTTDAELVEGVCSTGFTMEHVKD